MMHDCDKYQAKLGLLVDGELDSAERESVQSHVAACSVCQAEYGHLVELAKQLSTSTTAVAPTVLWRTIEQRLHGKSVAASISPAAHRSHPANYSLFPKPLLAAAVLLMAVGLGWLVVDAPWETPALAGQLDFEPLLAQADGDIEAGIQALIKTYGGEAISSSAAARRMKIRVHTPEKLPPALQLQGQYLLNMGRSHRSLAFHFRSPSGQHLLLLQCPPEMQKKYGKVECVACAVSEHNGAGVEVGKLRLMHRASDNVCVCIVTTLGQDALDEALAQVKIDY